MLLGKPFERGELAPFIKKVMRHSALDEGFQAKADRAAALWGIPPREAELLALAVARRSRREILDEMGIRDNTYKSLVSRMLRRTSHESLDELVREALDEP